MTDNYQIDKVSDVNEPRPFSAGVALREARERLELSVADVANRLKFAPRQIEALELDDFGRLPETAFVRGFVRSYAKLLQLDPVPLMEALPRPPVQAPPTPESAPMEVPFPNIYAARRLNIIWMSGVFAVAVLLGLFVWLHDSQSSAPEVVPPTVETVELHLLEDSVESVAAAATTEEITSTAISTPAIIQPVTSVASGAGALIHLVFDEESWVAVTDKDGHILQSQINPRGSEQRLSGKPPFSLIIGNASGVRLYYQGKRVDMTPYNKAEIARLTLE